MMCRGFPDGPDTQAVTQRPRQCRGGEELHGASWPVRTARPKGRLSASHPARVSLADQTRHVIDGVRCTIKSGPCQIPANNSAGKATFSSQASPTNKRYDLVEEVCSQTNDRCLSADFPQDGNDTFQLSWKLAPNWRPLTTRRTIRQAPAPF